MKVIIASDHTGVDVKNKIKKQLSEDEILDYGINNHPLDDYPQYAFKVAEFVRDNPDYKGILICGTGIGMSIAANKVKGIRCAHVSNKEEARLARAHNNANIIAISAKYDLKLIEECIQTFLTSEFEGAERLLRRNKLIEQYERENMK